MAERYAVYFAPQAGSGHDEFGTRWLGRDARSGRMLPQPRIEGVAQSRFAALTASARRYGLHATLKPPFYLKAAGDLPRLDARLREIAASFTPFEFPVGVAPLDGFLAWRALDRHDALSGIAATCVSELDVFRRAPTGAELARRRSAGLSGHQQALLSRWGYPYVHDEYRFHITLSDRLSGDEAAHLGRALDENAAHLVEVPLRFEELALFVEEGEGAGFRHVGSYGFDGSVRRFGEGAR